MSRPTYTRQGMTRAVHSIEIKNGQKVYVKTNLTSQQIDNYLRLEKLQIGIPIVHYDKEAGMICMEEGTTIQQLIDDGYAAPYYYFKQLKFLQEKLKSNKIAHCDVKPANMVWSDKNGLCLIDSDDIVEFGSIRQVGTPGINCSLNKLTQNETVDAQTDKQGFDYIHEHLDYNPRYDRPRVGCQLM